MKILMIPVMLFACTSLQAQRSDAAYPQPEFTNEVCFLKKDSVASVMRLEKAVSKMQSKVKMGGFGGSESGYVWEGSTSSVQLNGSDRLSFIYSTGASVNSSTPQKDSMLLANGIDPATINDPGGLTSYMDPVNTIVLYRAEPGHGERKITLQKTPGAAPFASKKNKYASKYTLSVKKVRAGYWELVVDKPLPSGEYAFTVANMQSADGSTVIFAFAIR